MTVVVLLVALIGGGGGWTVAAKPDLLGMAAVSAQSSPAATPTHSSTAPPPTVINCRDQVRAGDKAVKAARQSYQDWYQHVHAELDLDAGKITFDQAQAIWERTHKLGSKDMSRFDSTKILYENRGKACSKVVPEQVLAPFTDDAHDCKTRQAAIADTIAAGSKVAADWSKHTLQHRTKQTADPSAYHEAWMKAVHAAPAHLKAFRTQYAAYKKAPSCFAQPKQGE
ncbi:MAG: hypothetical protein ACRDMV_24480 [Streptosporangiales bacterium]